MGEKHCERSDRDAQIPVPFRWVYRSSVVLNDQKTDRDEEDDP